MRIRITFNVKNKGACVPFHHQHLISQVLRGFLLNSNDETLQGFSDYTFSGIKGQTKISRNGLHVNSNRVTIVITSPNRSFLDFIIGGIFSNEYLEFGQLIVKPERVDQEKQVDLHNQNKFICISPIVVVETSFNSEIGKQFIEPSTDEFSDSLFDITIKRMERSGIQTGAIKDLEKFQLVPEKEYIKKLRNSNKKFARIYSLYYQDVKYEVRGYTFPFVLYAPIEIQKFIFECGLGYYCQKGFGMIDIANSNPTNRAEPYEIKHLTSA